MQKNKIDTLEASLGLCHREIDSLAASPVRCIRDKDTGSRFTAER